MSETYFFQCKYKHMKRIANYLKSPKANSLFRQLADILLEGIELKRIDMVKVVTFMSQKSLTTTPLTVGNILSPEEFLQTIAKQISTDNYSLVQFRDDLVVLGLKISYALSLEIEYPHINSDGASTELDPLSVC